MLSFPLHFLKMVVEILYEVLGVTHQEIIPIKGELIPALADGFCITVLEPSQAILAKCKCFCWHNVSLFQYSYYSLYTDSITISYVQDLDVTFL